MLHNEHEDNLQEFADLEAQDIESQSTFVDSQLVACQQEVELWKDKATRIFADFDNYKKRMDREQASWMQTAQLSILKDLLTVVDNFDRALAAKTDENKDLYTGIEMIYKSVMQLLSKYGVSEFANYEQFDPELHEALMNVTSADHQSGQIVTVLEKGFMIKDKVLRPAKVTIAA